MCSFRPRRVGNLGLEMGLRILFVEDHTDTRNVLSRLLRHYGYEVDSVGTYESALAALSKSQFHILLSDIALPDGNGRDLVFEAKRRQDLIAVALSACSSGEDIQLGKAAGFDHYLTKPLDVAHLRSLLSETVV